MKTLITFITLLLVTAIYGAGGTKSISQDNFYFGSSASGTRELVFDQVPDGTSAKIQVNPTTDEFTLTRPVNMSDTLDVTGLTTLLNGLGITGTTTAEVVNSTTLTANAGFTVSGTTTKRFPPGYR